MEERHRAMTIDVDPKTWTIRQARRSSNAKLRAAMEQWARQERSNIEC